MIEPKQQHGHCLIISSHAAGVSQKHACGVAPFWVDCELVTVNTSDDIIFRLNNS